jgi:hypothetical protein
VPTAWCQQSGISGLVSAVWCQRSGGSSLMSAICCYPRRRNLCSIFTVAGYVELNLLPITCSTTPTIEASWKPVVITHWPSHWVLATGQRPPANGHRPTATGQRPPAKGQRPPVTGQWPTATLHLLLLFLLPNGIFVRCIHLSSLPHPRRSKLSGWKVLVLVNWGLKFPRHEC